jgi:competence protein ComEA
MGKWWGVAFGIVGGLLGAGLLVLVTRPPRGESIQLLPPPTPPALAVHIAGAVLHPGVFSLPEGCRVHEAVQAAGGLLPEADTGTLNLAAFVQDGERIWVPSKITIQEPQPSDRPPLGDGERSAPSIPLLPEPTPSPDKPVNINTASQADLESLPGIGPVIAQRIIAFRQEHGPFTRIEDIQEVAGIGPATYEKVKDSITISGP